jgi:hypothetical protein
MATETLPETLQHVIALFHDAELTLDWRKKVITTLGKFPGAYEALLKFAEECTPVEEGEMEAWEYALDQCSPEVDADGRLSFEIPYSVYFWDAKGLTWRSDDDDSDEDEDDEEEEIVNGSCS